MTLISVTKAAELLAIGRATAYRLAKEGRLPCVRSLGPVRIHLEKLQVLIDAEADSSMAKQRSMAALNSGPNGRPHYPPLRSPEANQREFDRLLASVGSKGSRKR